MIIAFILVPSASGSNSEPVLALDPSRGVIAMDLWETLNGCFKIPTSIELDLRNYPDDLGEHDAIVWRQLGSPITSYSLNEPRHKRNVESALTELNNLVASAPRRDTTKDWSPLVFDEANGVVRHQATTSFVHTCTKLNKTNQNQTIALDAWITECAEVARSQGEKLSLDMRGFHTNVLIPANSGKTLFEALNELRHPWAFHCVHYDEDGDYPAKDSCYLGSLPTYFLNSEGRLRILESYAKKGPTGCDGLP